MPKKHDRILALDVGSSTIKLAEFSAPGDGSIELVDFSVASIGLAPDREGEWVNHVTLTIKDMLREQGIRPGPVLLTVSGQQVFSRFVRLPPVDKGKVAQIVSYEAQQHVPFPIDEVVWDYQLIGTEESELDVMLVAIKSGIVEELTVAVDEAGLTTDLVDVAPMALYNAARYNEADVQGCTLLIDIGARSTDLIFLEEGRVFIRSIPVAGNMVSQQISREMDLSFDDAETLKLEKAFVGLGGAYEAHEDAEADRVSKIVRNVMTKMHAEINRSINFYRGQQGGSKPVRLLLAGGTSAIRGVDVFFREKLKIPVESFNPFSSVAVQDSIDAGTVAAYVNVLGQVVGLGLRRGLSCPLEINLMPATVQASKELRRRRPTFVLAGIGIVLALLVWCMFFFKMAQIAEKKLEQVNVKVGQLDKEQRQIAKVKKELVTAKVGIESLQELFPEREAWLRILDEIRRQVPDGMFLTAINPCGEQGGGGMGSPGMMMDSAMFGGFMPPGGGGAFAGEAEMTEELGCIEVAAMGYQDKIPSWQPVRDFRDALRSSPLFAEETEITWTPPANDMARQFKIEIQLNNPLPR